jgi:succinate dehydrogenase / fumarate reductase cytochrome b subunit
MAVSILHRLTGSALSIAGLAALTWWLVAIAEGADAYDSFGGWMWADLGQLSWDRAALVGSVIKVLLRLMLIGLTWSFFQHMLSGIRHLAMDTGAAFELNTNKRFAILTIVGSLVITALVWTYLLGVRP